MRQFRVFHACEWLMTLGFMIPGQYHVRIGGCHALNYIHKVVPSRIISKCHQVVQEPIVGIRDITNMNDKWYFRLQRRYQVHGFMRFLQSHIPKNPHFYSFRICFRRCGKWWRCHFHPITGASTQAPTHFLRPAHKDGGGLPQREYHCAWASEFNLKSQSSTQPLTHPTNEASAVPTTLLNTPTY